VAPDWLGYGLTDKLYDFGGGQARMVAHMRRFMQVMELEDSHVVGNSMGAGLFSKSIAPVPQDYRIRSLTMIAGGGFNPDNEHRRAMVNYDCTMDGMRTMLRAMFVDRNGARTPTMSSAASIRASVTGHGKVSLHRVSRTRWCHRANSSASLTIRRTRTSPCPC
jgi:pimeloyl-ACP methyl ester carboxylesterase